VSSVATGRCSAPTGTTKSSSGPSVTSPSASSIVRRPSRSDLRQPGVQQDSRSSCHCAWLGRFVRTGLLTNTDSVLSVDQMTGTPDQGTSTKVAPMAHAEVIEWANSMVGPLAQRATEAEQLRQLPQVTLDDTDAAGIFKMVVPTEVGGWGLGLRTLTESTRILAHGCVSSAWTLSFLIMHNWFVARGSSELQADLWAERPYVLMPCPLAPTGTAKSVDGGFELTGRWQWATGIQHADWVMVNSMIDRGNGPESMFCLAPVGDIEVEDVWNTSGMRGTGSNDVIANGVFIPANRTLIAAEWRAETPPGAALTDNPFVSYPVTPVLVLMAAAPALGGAEAAVDLFREQVRSRVLPYSIGDRQAEQPASQVRLAEALATVRAARLVWDDAVNRMCEIHDAGGHLQPAERGQFRLAGAHTVRLSLQAVSILLEGAGASVHFEGSALGRIHRDITTLKGHVAFDWDRAAALAGKLEAGIEPLPTDML
jgi:3-hydroxy-9,10-secoandrosta-1,3,5(10)-triene-9,17-dione monooxygenase